MMLIFFFFFKLEQNVRSIILIDALPAAESRSVLHSKLQLKLNLNSKTIVNLY